jgi:argininosuccinate lyase
MSLKQWGGRFEGGTDARMEAFSESISFDRRLYKHDIRASKAHSAMLAEVGLITAKEAEQIQHALTEIEADIDHEKMEFSISLEDIHTHVEQALIAKLGDTGRKLHTGRSRNDQVVTDVKLWVRDAIDDLNLRLLDLQKAFVGFGERERNTIVPGYTHLQRAQPVLASHVFLAYVEKFGRDRDRLIEARRRLNVLPLGAAALAGSSLPIDRNSVCQKLGFDSVARNSLDVSSDRDFLLDFVYSLSVIATHLSGWAEEWILWSTTEFDFIKLADSFCTGSSIMPHKKNPDALELTRGKSAKVIASLQQLFILLKGLPLAYNRDLQEDKTALFDAFDTVQGMLAVAVPLVNGTSLKQESINSKLEDGFLDATTLMESFIKAGVPMRTAHEAVGSLVKQAEQKRCRLADLPTSAFEAFCPGIGPNLKTVLGVQNAVNAFRSYGSTAPAEVEKQLVEARKRLESQVV